jgi:hypothetical protein
MAEKHLPTASLVRQLFTYDAKTGELTHNQRDMTLFHREGDMLRWNTCFAGKCATSLGKNGYLSVGISNKRYFAHRIAWLITHGEWPDTIDHINGKTDDNRIDNLRSVSRASNQRNLAISMVSSSGHRGVYLDRGKFVAKINDGGRQKHLGRFIDARDAINARISAEVELGYHENHGRRGHVA